MANSTNLRRCRGDTGSILTAIKMQRLKTEFVCGQNVDIQSISDHEDTIGFSRLQSGEFESMLEDGAVRLFESEGGTVQNELEMISESEVP